MYKYEGFSIKSKCAFRLSLFLLLYNAKVFASKEDRRVSLRQLIVKVASSGQYQFGSGTFPIYYHWDHCPLYAHCYGHDWPLFGYGRDA